MGLGRLLFKFAGAAAIAAAAGLCVFSLGFALYALARDPLGPAGAAAVVALAAALAAGLGGWLLFGLKGVRHEPKGRAGSLTERLVDAARDRPLVAAAIAVSAGLIFVRNPALVTMLAAALSQRRPARRR